MSAPGSHPSHDLITAIEAASAHAWPATETAALHGWRLRYGGAHSRRLNSVQTLDFHAGTDLEAVIDRVIGWYAERSLPPCFRLTDIVRPTDLDALLAARGYAHITPTSVMVIDATAIPRVPGIPVELLAEATPDVLQAICDTQWSDTTRRERTALFARIDAMHRFALVTVDGQHAAGGLCVRNGDLAGIFSMRTQPPFRRRGLARAVLVRLALWAHAEGARRLYLQVEDDNAPALRLYRDLGFTRLYGYHYREQAA